MQVQIYQPVKSPMQSAKSKNKWFIQFEKNHNGKFKESLMGRTSSYDMSSQTRISFDNLAEAIAFAQSQNYQYEIIEPNERKIIKKNYANNFVR